MEEFKRKLKGLGFTTREDDYFIFIECNEILYGVFTKSTKETTFLKSIGTLDKKLRLILIEIVTEYFYDEMEKTDE